MSVLLRPIITEKSLHMAGDRQYTFEVDRRANAIEIARAIEVQFGVKVTDVRVLNIAGHARRYRRSIGQTRAWKKAIVTLAVGNKIVGFELETEDHAKHAHASDKITTVTTKKKSDNPQRG